ncbi:MAG TPA: tetratricopeptide repeat protein [Actinospica sp.]|nr:tetratricopeptide repeat protein [Actinospica sp.]
MVNEDAYPNPDRVVDLAEFIQELDRLRLWAGGPSFRVLAKRVGPLMRPPQAVAHTTIGGVFQPRRRRLDLDLVTAIVRALGVPESEVARWRAACVRVHAAAKTSSTGGAFRQLPPDLATFTGREAEIERLMQAADASSPATPTVLVAVIEGMGGVGKTQLAVHAAHQLIQAGRYADLQLYTNLRGFDPDRPPADPAAVLDSFLRQLGVAAQHVPETLEERAAMFRDRMHGKDALVLLDNAADIDQVRDLIPGGPGCLVLITSRRSLSALDNSVVTMLGVLEPEESVQLLARIAGPERIAAEPQAARRIAELCGGLPLAVSLAAARLRSRPAWRLQDLVDRLAKGLSEMTTGGQDVSAVFALSYEGQPDEARRVFRLLGIDPGLDATADSVAALAGISGEAADVILELLQDENLIGQQTAGRYELHDLLRAFAARTCRATDPEADQQVAISRYLSWHLSGAHAAMDVLNPKRNRPDALPDTPGITAPVFADADRARAWLTAERANLLAATRHAATCGRPGHAWRFTQALSPFYFMAGYNADWAESRRYGMAAAEAEDDAFAQAEILHVQGMADAIAGRYDEALRNTREALRYREVVGDRRQLAGTLGNLACVHHDLGQLRRAVGIYAEVLTIMRETGSREGEAYCLLNLGIASAAMGRHQQAVDWLDESMTLHRAVDTLGEMHSTTLVSIAVNLSLLGEHDRALTMAIEGAELAERLGARKKYAEAVNILGELATNRADFEQAARTYRQAEQIARDIGDQSEQIQSVVNLGVNALRSGAPAVALQFFDEARALLGDQHQNRWALLVAQSTGDAFLALGDVSSARKQYHRVLHSQEESDTQARTRAAYGLARIALAHNPPDYPTAREWLEQATFIYGDAQIPALKQQLESALTDVAIALSVVGHPIAHP